MSKLARWVKTPTIACLIPLASASARDAATDLRNSDSDVELTVCGKFRHRATFFVGHAAGRERPSTRISRGGNRTGWLLRPRSKFGTCARSVATRPSSLLRGASAGIDLSAPRRAAAPGELLLQRRRCERLPLAERLRVPSVRTRVGDAVPPRAGGPHCTTAKASRSFAAASDANHGNANPFGDRRTPGRSSIWASAASYSSREGLFSPII